MIYICICISMEVVDQWWGYKGTFQATNEA